MKERPKPPMLRLTDKLTEQIASHVEKGVPLPTALKAAGVTDATVQLWHQVVRGAEHLTDGTVVDLVTRQWVSGFVARVGQAEAILEANLIGNIADTSAIVGKSGVPEWRAGAWLLNNHPRYRETYRQQREVRITGMVTHSREDAFAESMTDAQLDAWIPLALSAET